MIITIVRKPLIENVCKNITLHNTGGINIEKCRVGNEDTRSPTSLSALGQNSGWNNHENRVVLAGSANGRWPANVLISATLSEIMNDQSGVLRARGNKGCSKGGGGLYGHKETVNNFGFGNVGGASRFFKVVKEND